MTNAEELLLDSRAGEYIGRFTKTNPITGAKEELFDIYEAIPSKAHPTPKNVRMFWALDAASNTELGGITVEMNAAQVEVDAKLFGHPKELSEDDCLRELARGLLEEECGEVPSDKPVIMRVGHFGVAGALEHYVAIHVTTEASSN